jgi:aminoglycoside phosphotransferase (APT) family kinase protein
MPAAEVDLSVDLVRRLLAAQQPDLAHLPIDVLTNGWDNLLCRLGDELVVRLPRRALAAELVLHEQRWLPVLAPRLPLPVPAPVRVGAPTADYPWSWSVVPFLPGQPAALRAPASPHDAARSLGRFLGALHVPAAPEAPANPYRGVPLMQRDQTVGARMSQLADSIDRNAAMTVWDAAVAAPAWDGAPVWLHGDLHPANILVHEGGISAVIDFGDITSGDPAGDLSVAWMMLPADSHDAFRDGYRDISSDPISADTWTRA